MTEKVIHFGDLAVQVIRKKIRNLNLRIYPGGQVRVSIPISVKEETVRQLIGKRLPWIRRKQAQLATVASLTMTKGEQIQFRKQLRLQLPRLIKKWEPIMGVKVKEWRIRRMKTRWGTCNTRAKRIWINLELARRSEGCLEYVVVHEMCHLLEANHGPRFKKLMDQFLPGWQATRKELRGKTLPA